MIAVSRVASDMTFPSPHPLYQRILVPVCGGPAYRLVLVLEECRRAELRGSGGINVTSFELITDYEALVLRSVAAEVLRRTRKLLRATSRTRCGHPSQRSICSLRLSPLMHQAQKCSQLLVAKRYWSSPRRERARATTSSPEYLVLHSSRIQVSRPPANWVSDTSCTGPRCSERDHPA